ncbi:MAG: sulfurtransferase TusA family protein [Candidatus Thorarchaeota archaeon]
MSNISEGKRELKKIDKKLYELDVRGLVCPFPQVLVTNALSNLSKEYILEVIIDNPPSVRDIPPALEKKGYETRVEKIDKINSKLIVKYKS